MCAVSLMGTALSCVTALSCSGGTVAAENLSLCCLADGHSFELCHGHLLPVVALLILSLFVDGHQEESFVSNQQLHCPEMLLYWYAANMQ